jgi:hypothetical protein
VKRFGKRDDNAENIGKILKKIVKRFGKYRRKLWKKIG